MQEVGRNVSMIFLDGHFSDGVRFSPSFFIHSLVRWVGFCFTIVNTCFCITHELVRISSFGPEGSLCKYIDRQQDRKCVVSTWGIGK